MSWKWGIARSSNEGDSFDTPGFAMGTGKIPVDTTVRFIVQHPTDASILYAGADGPGLTGGGLFKISNAKSTPTVTKLAGSGAAALTAKTWVRDGVAVVEGGIPYLYL